jgi:hypothetical protein
MPVNILNESLGILEHLGYITPIQLESAGDELERTGYQPAKPLSALSLARFRSAVEQVGEGGPVAALLQADPLLKEYHESLQWPADDPLGQSDLAALLDRSNTAAQQP